MCSLVSNRVCFWTIKAGMVVLNISHDSLDNLNLSTVAGSLGHQARHREATGLIFQHATSPVIVKNEIFSSPPQYTFSVGTKIKFCDVKTSSKPSTVNSTRCMKMIFYASELTHPLQWGHWCGSQSGRAAPPLTPRTWTCRWWWGPHSSTRSSSLWTCIPEIRRLVKRKGYMCHFI